MTRIARAAALIVPVVLAGAPHRAAAQHRDAPKPYSFVVLGHLRGGHDEKLNPKIAEVVERVRALHPAFAVLTGDIVWGDVESNPSRPAIVEAEWNAIDSALNTLGIPIYRVPGNHDIPDLGTRDIWLRRYGSLPRVVPASGSRLILLSSAFIPRDGDTEHHKYIGGVDIDSAQLAFLRRTLADTGYAHTWVFTAHNLWWEPQDGPWWRQVHPLLAAARVDNVFSGDYGPMKFSTMEKDGVRYYQGSIELQVDIPRLQRFINSRLLSSQLDVFLEVRVSGDSSAVVVHPVAEVTSGEWTPDRWRSINRPPALTPRERLHDLVNNRRKLYLVAGAGLGTFLAGAFAGWLLKRRRAA